MSVMDVTGHKIVLPRGTSAGALEWIATHYAAKDPLRWRRLMMLVVHAEFGFTLETIGLAFGGLNKGHVSREIHRARRELTSQFRLPGRDDANDGASKDRPAEAA